jgi:hypothetical protein
LALRSAAIMGRAEARRVGAFRYFTYL